jgi:GntR family transcriptional regulator
MSRSRRALERNPIYQQLNAILRDQIRCGELAVGDQFPTEREVSERFQVSRATANKAISTLVAEGILEFRKGVGTFVREAVLDYDLRALVSFTDKAHAAGKTPSTRVLGFETRSRADLTGDDVEALGLAPHDPVYVIERLRLADGVPVIYERRLLAARYCPGLAAEALEGSLYSVLTEDYGLDVTGADEVIRAVALDPHEAGLLRVSAGSAALLVVATGFLQGGAPLWFERTLYRSDMYEFRNRLGPIRATSPATGALIAAG